jgi:thymidylate kinase
MLLSFSGIDGAGKSTQLVALHKRLTENGFQVLLLTFWDDVAVLKRFREAASQELFKGDQGIGTPEKPLHRRDKNVTSWYLTVVRFCLYLLDALHLNMVLVRALTGNADVILFDRYIYDELANLSSGRWFARAYIRLLLKSVPRPDVAYLLDTNPVLARARKPEYPVDFLRINRASYLALWKVAGMTVIPPLSILEAEQEIMRIMLKKWSGSEQSFSRKSYQVKSLPSGLPDTSNKRRS